MPSESQPEIQQLSEREREILRLVAQGLSNQQIAHHLGISVNTVKVHLRNVFSKIGAASRTEASMYAVRTGIITLESAPSAEAAPKPDVAPPPALHGTSQITPTEAPAPGVKEGAPQPLSPPEAQAIAARPPTVDRPPAQHVEPGSSLPTAETSVPPISTAVLQRRRLFLSGMLAATVLIIAGLVWLLRPTAITRSQEQPSDALPARWQRLGDMPEPRAAFAIATFEDRIYVVGGENEHGVLKSLMRFDVGSGTWTGLSPKPTAVTDVRAVVLSGKLYVPGGRRSANPTDITDRFERYDLRSEQWETLPKLPEPRSGYTLVTLDGKIYLIGGWDGTRYRTEVFEYDPERESWQMRSTMPTARAFAAAGVVEDRIYVMGGENEHGALTSNEIYTPALETAAPWSRRAPLPQPRTRMSTAMVLSSLILLGGEPTGIPAKYNVTTDSWDELEAPPAPIGAQPGVVLLNGKIYCLGGRLGPTQYSPQMQAYQAIFSQFLPR
ncbi:Kelch repeat-containing protein [Kallotenue papyrolyticum]|uniref:Kelch repeat-containing protein n=1 Tax=Kallotenue papyrolyticum TaxID=1325125 RepID=UPI000478619E|nr:kelch repeat-containing protein [Kallotenue papyrolyticum]